ncbi:MAG: histidine phosphatase family protein [Bifidobacteriaceae bacterium]|jgi:phosphohistidine phosphatase|nr:histidine phosphatase family protein [Bifidobacteriaceae bacterium]
MTDGSRRTLVLLRHARAEHTDFGSDGSRRLTAEGRAQAEAAGRAMARDGIVPDVVLCSAAARARETWELAAAHLGGAPAVTVSGDLYRAYVPELVEALRAVGAGVGAGVGTVLAVGHNPTVSATAAHLAALGSDPAALSRARVGLQTGAWAWLRFAGEWADLGAGGARLVGVLRGA